jgi:hypothetical protein
MPTPPPVPTRASGAGGADPTAASGGMHHGSRRHHHPPTLLRDGTRAAVPTLMSAHHGPIRAELPHPRDPRHRPREQTTQRMTLLLHQGVPAGVTSGWHSSARRTGAPPGSAVVAATTSPATSRPGMLRPRRRVGRLLRRVRHPAGVWVGGGLAGLNDGHELPDGLAVDETTLGRLFGYGHGTFTGLPLG